MSIFEKITELPFSDYFYTELQQSNAKHGESAPVTVFLIAEDAAAVTVKKEPNASTVWHPIQSMALRIGTTNRVAIRTLNQKKDIDQKLAEVEKEMGRKAHLLIIIGHGTPHSIKMRKENQVGENPNSPDSTLYQEDNVTKEDFCHLEPDARIILFSCKTGQHVKEGNLAQKIAKVAQRTVFAPTQKMSSLRTYLVDAPDTTSFGIRSCDTNYKNMICAFQSDGTVEEDPIFLEDDQIAGMVEYTEKHASEGDLDAELTMAFWGLRHIHGLKNEDAQKWFERAAGQGCAYAAFSMGVFYELGRLGIDQSPEQALIYYNLAAEHGNVDAQYKMGMAYLEGTCGTTQSDVDAFHWFQKAANQQHADAAFVVGQFYEKGGGADKSRSVPFLQAALYYYNLAAERGNTDAQYEMGVAYLEGKWGLFPSKQNAEAWLIKAADQKHEQAMLLLAEVKATQSGDMAAQ